MWGHRARSEPQVPGRKPSGETGQRVRSRGGSGGQGGPLRGVLGREKGLKCQLGKASQAVGKAQQEAKEGGS